MLREQSKTCKRERGTLPLSYDNISIFEDMKKVCICAWTRIRSNSGT